MAFHSQRLAATTARPMTPLRMSRFERADADSVEFEFEFGYEFGTERLGRGRSFEGTQRCRKANASDAHAGHRSSLWSSSQSRQRRASRSCIGVSAP